MCVVCCAFVCVCVVTPNNVSRYLRKSLYMVWNANVYIIWYHTVVWLNLGGCEPDECSICMHILFRCVAKLSADFDATKSWNVSVMSSMGKDAQWYCDKEYVAVTHGYVLSNENLRLCTSSLAGLKYCETISKTCWAMSDKTHWLKCGLTAKVTDINNMYIWAMLTVHLFREIPDYMIIRYI